MPKNLEQVLIMAFLHGLSLNAVGIHLAFTWMS
jgi:hypothetical protein